jgi:hypothetical protein
MNARRYCGKPDTMSIVKVSTITDPAFDADIFGDIDVWTPAADRLVEKLSKWIRIDSPGATVYGPQRVGKSHGIKFICKVLPHLFGGTLSCTHVTIGEPLAKTERAFMQRMLGQVGCNAMLSRDVEILRTRLVDHLFDKAMAAGSKRIFIAVDEAQNLERLHYGWLITLFNELVHRNLRPFFLLVGQPELRDVSQAFRVAGSQQVIGRFFSHGHEYYGVAPEELEDVLRALESEDANVSSGPRHRMPIQYAEGFSLTQLAMPLATALDTIRRQHQLAHAVRLPMQYLRSAVILALIRIIRGEVDHRSVSAVTMLDCLDETGFLNVVLVYAELMSEA